MTISRHKQFQRNYKKRILPFPDLDKRFESRFKLFLQNPNHPELKDHKLLGKLIGLRSFSVTGDIRVVYRQTRSSIELYDIGSHNQVY